MREFKFRAWNGAIFRYYPIGMSIYRMDRFEISQYTGLKDKNDVEIYEGDIIKGVSGYKEVNFLVMYSEGLCMFVINQNQVDDGTYISEMYGHKNLEVIGNIYENKELLDGKA